ncbi:CBS domain-containing protein [Nostoc sp.]|uniref:CBS domain-containing protein n=1 Tax=Nostoc sp. TaxID=1180 RepID=UPI002FF5B429
MTRDMVFIHTYTDQEEVARLSQRYDFLAVSVVDREQRLASIITINDVIYITEK